MATLLRGLAPYVGRICGSIAAPKMRSMSREGERLTVSAGISATPLNVRYQTELRDGRRLVRSRSAWSYGRRAAWRAGPTWKALPIAAW